MSDIIYCSICKSNGKKNRCYITGYNKKCGHDEGWAKFGNKDGGSIMKCSCCPGENNSCYITGYDIKCGHDMGYAYVPKKENKESKFGYILCSECKSEGLYNRCYITGYNKKCGHDEGYAKNYHKDGSSIMKCSCCPGENNSCYITGYDIKCGHDMGYAYVQGPEQKNVTCKTCGKNLKGKWCIEKKDSNNSNEMNLGISDAYFLSGDQPNLVYSYCKSCWKKEIQKILPKLDINVDSDNSEKELNQAKEIIEKQKIIINKKEEELKHLKLELKKINEKKRYMLKLIK